MDINNLKSYSTFDSFSRFETRSNWRLLTQIIWKETEIYLRIWKFFNTIYRFLVKYFENCIREWAQDKISSKI